MSDNGNTNPNVETTAPEVPVSGVVEIPAGETFTSFEALERVHNSARSAKRAATKAAKEESPAEVVDSPKDEKIEEQKPIEAKSEEKSGKEEAPLKNAPTEDTSLVEVTVDGKKEQVSLKDLKNHYSGKVAWDKKFTELDKERKSYQSEKQAIEHTWNSFVDKSGKDPKAAILELCQMTNVDSVTFIKNLRNAMIPEIKKLSQMSEPERRAYEAEEELSLLKSAKESENQRVQREQETTSLTKRIEEIQETYKLDLDTTKQYYSELKNIVTDRAIEIDDIATYASLKANYNTVTSAMESIRPDLLSDNDVVSSLVTSLSENPELTVEDLQDIITQAYGKSKTSKVLKSKVDKAAKAEGIQNNIEIQQLSKNPNSDPINFEDLE